MPSNPKDVPDNTTVVGIGASAGGLEALQEFFKNMPLQTNMAFVVIQHLSPDYKSLMDELLARYTSISIQIIRDGTPVLPNNIYLIPPRKNIILFHNKIYLEEQGIRKGLNLPVDIFFRSLAMDKGKNAIGIVLSGTGSDGTLGIRAIKEAGGMVMVQDEQSAKFGGMPRNSISTGLVDYILPPDKMPEALVNFIKHPLVNKTQTLDNVLSGNIDTLTKIIIILRNFSGIDFSFYKENTIIRRLERRVSINRFNTLEEYLIFLSESDKEKDTLYRELLIGVTRFFRDNDAFESIKKNVLPWITKKKTCRIWSAGCSTGEEVYSLAILVNEYLENNALECEVKIFATDIDKNSVEHASKGIYPDSIMADVDPALSGKYFIRTSNGYQVNDTIRKMIVFATHNLLKDSPFSKLDLLVCRNLFIYLKPDVQNRILSIFYYSINSDGFLFMGSSETVGEMDNAFECIDIKWKIYKYVPGYKPYIVNNMPLLQSVSEIERSVSNKTRYVEGIKFERLMDGIMSSFLPASLVVDENENILHVINDISPFVKLQPGRFSQNLFSNLSQDLSLFVSTILRKIKRNDSDAAFENLLGIKGFENKKITIEGRKIKVEKSYFYVISFTCKPIETEIEKKILLSSQEQKECHQICDKIADLEKELKFTKESLQSTVEELETSNEELQSSNEELIASNEELQSTNEELQSVNEELYTVNSEYQEKIQELISLNNDINNLLRNTEVGALYLDKNLCIRKITPSVSSITNIMLSDIGRPIKHISLQNLSPSFMEDIHKVLETLQPIDRKIAWENDITYLLRIRPYRTEFNSVEGILVLFIDITHFTREHKRAELASKRLGFALDAGRMAWWEWNLLTDKIVFDDRKATMLGYTVEEFPKSMEQLISIIHPDDHKAVIQSQKDYLAGKVPSWEITYRIRQKQGTYSWYYKTGNIVEKNQNDRPTKMAGTVIEISDLKNLESELHHKQDLLEKVLENSPIAQTLLNKEGTIIYANKKAEEILGITKEQIIRRTYDASEWKITDVHGKSIPSEELPFAIIKKSLKNVDSYRHYIEIPGKQKALLHIHGSPIMNSNQLFEGAVFTIGVI
ncbi:MAG: PAS domain-containing protein [Candidatus Brocadiae bacterium]|nr:PAS domain-containing protein [Candidatus Brocadiia bacterium]